MLEYFVHLDKDDTPRDLVLAVAEVPDDLSQEEVEVSHLPANWRLPAAPPELTGIGDEFLRRGEHCLLLVPSALAPDEHNCLINPRSEERRVGKECNYRSWQRDKSKNDRTMEQLQAHEN